jgi:DNA-binding MarR family transcriptional regulator
MSRSERQPYTQSLLLAAYQASARVLVDALHAAGHGAIRHKHGAVFANIDLDGTRPSVLAERAQMGKAAMGELVDELARLDYVRREPDPTDGRAKLVIPTESALEVTALVHEVNEEVERRYRSRLGDEGFRALREALGQIGEGEALMQPRIRV